MSTDNMKDLPITRNFEHSQQIGYAKIYLENISNPAEYVLSPEMEYDTDTKEWAILGYSLIHISTLPTFEQLQEKMKQVTG